MDRIKQLTEHVAKNRRDREMDALASKAEKERRLVYEQAPSPTMVPFWCDQCKADFTAVGTKYVLAGYDITADVSYTLSPFKAQYTGLCPKQHRAFRRIHDKHGDPYFSKSVVVRQDRQRFADDLLQPSDPRFAKVYPAQWAKIQEEREEARQRENAMNLTN